MDQEQLKDAFALVKRMSALLGETVDLSRQLGEALDRRDNVAAEMLVAMRGEPIEKLAAADQALIHLTETLPAPEDRERLKALLNGAPADSPEEEPLAARVAANRRMLKQARELDQVLTAKMTRTEAPKAQLNSRA